jgi:cardiolipin synthase
LPRSSVQDTSFIHNNTATLVRGGKDFFTTIIRLINESKDTLHLQFYIYDPDETGQQVADALKEAAKRGVKVYVVVDGFASQSLTKEFIEDLKAANVHFRFFEPLFRSTNYYFGRRLHHKLVVADARVGLVGGINISNKYNDLPGEPAWLDFGILVEGEIVHELCKLACETWRKFPDKLGKTPCDRKEVKFNIPEDQKVDVRMRRNDWVKNKNQISDTYRQLLGGAKSDVIILCAYFLPSEFVRNLLRRILAKGVKVRVIIAGKSDVMIIKRAERWFYDWLLRNGIEVYEYEKNILHGKIATVDDEWMTIGSYNINDISAFASVELNLDVKNAAFARHTREVLEEIIKNDCTRITPRKLKTSRNLFMRLMNWISYKVFRILFFLFTFYFKQRR